MRRLAKMKHHKKKSVLDNLKEEDYKKDILEFNQL